jgi:phosphate starvation-inducible PhoH-like protein
MITAFQPANPLQTKLQNMLADPHYSLLVVTGPAGTGKTLLSLNEGLKALKDKKKDRVLFTRPIVTVNTEQLGFLPGDINDKMNPWIQTLYDSLTTLEVKKTELDKYVNDGKLVTIPLGFMRGRTFTNSFVLADEMQNTTPEQMKMLLTRIGKNSKLVVIGDTEQSDIRGLNGLKDLKKKLSNYQPHETHKIGIGTVEFENTHIQRHHLLPFILSMYESRNIQEIQ